VSGRVSVQFARVLMANWKAAESSDLNKLAVARMEAICIGLGDEVESQEISSLRCADFWSWNNYS
jgi:hypothetical protein